jgi:uncharacterized protein YdaL
MSLRARWTLRFASSLCLLVGCSGLHEESSQDSPPPLARASHEGSTHVSNAFTPAHGDVREAYARALARLGRNDASQSQRRLAADGPATGTLVLYDETGPWGWLGELYAINVGALVSHFGTWTAKPASQYVAGELSAYAGAVYVGSTFDEPLPAAMLDDVLAGTRPVVWIDYNIWQLAARAPGGFGASYGFDPWYFDTSDFARVDYKGTSLTRYEPNGAGVMLYSALTTAKVLAQAVRTSDGASIPWAVRGKNVTYIGENPMAYVTSNDRYLAFADLLFDAFAPETPERHRALVRIEDVNATTSPSALRSIADYLWSQKVPFGIATIPYYKDPLGAVDGTPQSIPLKDAPAVVDAIKYMLTKGGTIVMHGYTHQYESTPNPYNGVTADDFEFYASHIDAANYVVYDGPVALDSQAWAAQRIAAGLAELAAAGLPAPTIFEYPHYAGSAADSLAVRDRFATVYHRGIYPSGLLRGQPPNYAHVIGVMYPYGARDPFGFAVIPENLGSYEPEPANNNPPRLVSDILATAQVNRVVRDGFASFYFHPYYPVSVLRQIVSGIKARGYSFVSPTAL